MLINGRIATIPARSTDTIRESSDFRCDSGHGEPAGSEDRTGCQRK
jgi:hypothetical protein